MMLIFKGYKRSRDKAFENIMGKGEIAGYQHSHFLKVINSFSQMANFRLFQKKEVAYDNFKFDKSDVNPLLHRYSF